MKFPLILVLSMVCILAFGFGFGGKKKDSVPETISIQTDSGPLSITVDYSLKTSEQKLAKLQTIESYEDYFLNQLLVENDKYDLLIAKRALNDYRSGRTSASSLEKEISKQKKKAIALLAKRESLVKYIDWLKS